ncbi:MAG: hypothetical protein AAGB23_07670 [Pseudomonadota bacterium]
MTEEQIREIVRDEIELECLREGGIYDKTRQVAWNVNRGTCELIADYMRAMWEGHSKSGPN